MLQRGPGCAPGVAVLASLGRHTCVTWVACSIWRVSVAKQHLVDSALSASSSVRPVPVGMDLDVHLGVAAVALLGHRASDTGRSQLQQGGG